MKKLIKIEKTVIESIEKEVDFPIYSKTIYENKKMNRVTKTFTRIDDNFTETSISMFLENGEESLTIEILPKKSFYGDINYELGLNEFVCTKEEFDEQLERAIKILRE